MSNKPNLINHKYIPGGVWQEEIDISDKVLEIHLIIICHPCGSHLEMINQNKRHDKNLEMENEAKQKCTYASQSND